MISARGATPCNLMLNEVGRAHVAGAVPIVYQPTEVFKVWGAVSNYLRGALLAGINVSLFRKTISFSCSKRKVFKKIPKSFHREAQVFDLRVPLFGVAPNFAVTYSLDSPIIEEHSLQYTQMPLKSIAESSKLPTNVVAAVLHDVMRFVGEGLFQGRLLELEFPGVALVRIKRDRVMAIFDDAFTAELLAIDTRKWPAAFAQEARELLIRPKTSSSVENRGRPSSARSGSGNVNNRRPASAATSSSKAARQQPQDEFKPGSPFCNAPAPSGRTFDEMYEIRQQEVARKTRSVSARGSAASAAVIKPTAALADEDIQSPSTTNNKNANVAGVKKTDGTSNSPLAVVYDESVPADHLPKRSENVYDMVMPEPNQQQQRLDMSTGTMPSATINGPPVPMPHPENQQQQQQQQQNIPPPVANAAAASSTNMYHQQKHHQQQQAGVVPRRLQTNSHVALFGELGVVEVQRPSTCRKRWYGSTPYPETSYPEAASSS